MKRSPAFSFLVRGGTLLLTALAVVAVLTAGSANAAPWNPEAWSKESTLRFRTECEGEKEHWSYVWLVVLDGDVWVRLGSRAAGRLDCNRTERQVAVRIGGQEYAVVDLVEMPEMAGRVAEAMRQKYWTDFLVRGLAHPYTMKLVPADD